MIYMEKVSAFSTFVAKAKAKVYFEEGNKAYREKDYINAIHLYTQGIQENCQDVQLNTRLYNNRTMAKYYLDKIYLFVLLPYLEI